MSTFLILLSGDVGAIVKVGLMISLPVALIAGVVTYKLVPESSGAFMKTSIAIIAGIILLVITMMGFFSILG